jgi:hypothetical protein
VPTSESVNCATDEPGIEVASLDPPAIGAPDGAPSAAIPLKFEKFTSQDELGAFLVNHYKIRTPKELTSCEVCHR